MDNAAKLRAWWSHRQGLDGRLAGLTAAEVLEATGWTRSVGGAALNLLVSSLDNISHLRRDLPSLMAAEDRNANLASCNALMDRPDHAIFDRGRLVGLRQFDPTGGRIVWMVIREDLQDFRSFSLDSPRSRQPRIDALRETRAA